MEIFKDIQGYEKRYEISSDGVVRRKKDLSIVAQTINYKGYSAICLNLNSKSSSHRAHRLVMKTFNPNKDCDSLQVNHINGIKTDNRLENLEWVSNRENTSHFHANKPNKTSKYAGVSFSKNHQKYIAQVMFNRKNIYLGIFENEERAYLEVMTFKSKNKIENKYM